VRPEPEPEAEPGAAAIGGRRAAPAGRPDGGLPGRPGWAPLVPLLCGTFVGTLNNNVLNAPLRLVVASLRVSVSSGALVVVSYPLALAVAMPLAGWYADRVGRKRLFVASVLALCVTSAGASLAPDIAALVAFRVLQGLSSAAILPCVMGLITEIYEPGRRGRALGLWAAANGLGQTVGPPLGGLVASSVGWRFVFVPAIAVGLVAAAGAGADRRVPGGPGHRSRLEVRGAALLTAGTGLVIASAMLVPIVHVASVVAILAAVGVAGRALRAVGRREVREPFVDPQLWREPSFLRSSLAAFAQMFCLGTTLLAVPLYLTRSGSLAPASAGLVVFSLPVTMTLLAPVAGVAAERVGPRRVLRSGLGVLALAELALAALAGSTLELPLLVVSLVVAGLGIALVQTPAAAGATRSAVGRVGTGLGLFNSARFAGSALGGAWVAVVLAHAPRYRLGFVVAAAAAAAGLVATFAGPDSPRTSGSRAAVSAGG